jgi:hypothetical protein
MRIAAARMLRIRFPASLTLSGRSPSHAGFVIGFLPEKESS